MQTKKIISIALTAALVSSIAAVATVSASALEQVPEGFNKDSLADHTMGIIGSFNEWTEDVAAMTDADGDGIYLGVVEDVAAGSYDFKIRLDSAWDYSWGVYEEAEDRTFNSQTNCSLTLDSTSDVVVVLDTNGEDANVWSVAYFALPDEGGDQSGAFVAADHTYGAIGDFNTWGGDVAMTELASGVYCANIGDIAATQGFKVRADGAWDYSWGVYEAADDRTQNSQTNCSLTEDGKNVHLILNTNGADFQIWQVAYFYTAPDGSLKFVDVGPNAAAPDEPSTDESTEPSTDEPVEPSIEENYETQISDYIFFDNSETQWETVHAHWWNDDYTKIVDLEGNLWPAEPLDENGNQDFGNAWPGTEMTQIPGTDIWQARVPFGATKIVFNNGMKDDEISKDVIPDEQVQAIADGDTSVATLLAAGVGIQTSDLEFDSTANAGQIYKIDTTTAPTSARGNWKNRKWSYGAGAWEAYEGEYSSEILNEAPIINEDPSVEPGTSDESSDENTPDDSDEPNIPEDSDVSDNGTSTPGGNTNTPGGNNNGGSSTGDGAVVATGDTAVPAVFAVIAIAALGVAIVAFKKKERA